MSAAGFRHARVRHVARGFVPGELSGRGALAACAFQTAGREPRGYAGTFLLLLHQIVKNENAEDHEQADGKNVIHVQLLVAVTRFIESIARAGLKKASARFFLSARRPLKSSEKRNKT